MWVFHVVVFCLVLLLLLWGGEGVRGFGEGCYVLFFCCYFLWRGKKLFPVIIKCVQVIFGSL